MAMAVATSGRLTASSRTLLIAQAPVFTVRNSSVGGNTIHEHTQSAVENTRGANDPIIENVAQVVHENTGNSQNVASYSKVREAMELFRARERHLMWKTNVGSSGNLPGFRKRFLGGALDRTGFISPNGSRCITRPVDWTRVPYMTFPKRERRRKYRIKSLEEKESDRGWHPELCTYESEFQKMHALYFYNLLAFPWEKGAFERFVDKLEKKYFPDEHIDALVPPKDKVPVKAQGRSKKNKDEKFQERVSSLQELRTITGDQTPRIQTADTDQSTEERRPGYVEYSADDWQPVSDTSEYTESVSNDVPVKKYRRTSPLAPKPPIIERGMALPENWDGPLGTVVLIDKPVGWTSFTVCGKLRKLLKIQKVGHAGTLDPMATGLLVVCVGKATKFADSYQAMRKVYSGTMRLGEATPSYDADTMVSERLPWEHVTDEDVQLIKQEFVGTIRQVPPLYSALKVEGEKLYEKARRGETFQLPPRLISIDELHLERDSENRQDFHFKVVCSKGTYIRSLCYDIGRALNTCAHLVALRRDRIGDMSVEDAWQFSELGKHYADDFLGKACSKTSNIPEKMSLEDAWEFPELQNNLDPRTKRIIQQIVPDFSDCECCRGTQEDWVSLSRMNNEIVKHKYKFCGCLSRSYRMSAVSPPSDVQDVFNKYAPHGTMGPQQLQQFLVEVQGEKDATVKDAEELIVAQNRESRHLLGFNRHEFNLNTFLQFLFNPQLCPIINTKVHHDMNKPMSHYYIFTGHNSYLTGNQLSSECSEKPIIKALLRGVRVIELDLWPNGDKPGCINVLHGRTLTSPVDFEKCIIAIKDHAFVASEYPLVITLEDHLTPPLQAKVAEIITWVLGEFLFVPTEETTFKEFPSPASFKKRITISTKPPKEYLGAVEPPKDVVPHHHKEGEWGTDIPDPEEQEKRSAEKENPPAAPDTDGDDSDEDEGSQKAPEYKGIITIRAGKPKGIPMKEAMAAAMEEDSVKRFSISEPQLEKLCKNHPKLVIKFTSKNFLRVYPYGLRFFSSNYNPFVGWSHGAQMVAFNMQGYGRLLWVVHGFFKANGGCGYIKKPDVFLPTETGGPVYDPYKELPVRMVLNIKIHMGFGWLEKFGKKHFDTFSPPDFYARVGVAGVPKDQKMRRTKAIEDDWHPKWGEEFSFKLTFPELAVLRIEVHEYDTADKDDFGGQVCLPVSELKTGFRSVTLCDKRGDELTGVKVLLTISTTDYRF